MSLQMWDFVEPHAYESDTDLDSDDDDHTGFSPTRYSEAQIRQALMRPYDYIRAVEELRCCILHFYGRSQMSKDMRHVIEEDATQAFLVQNRGIESQTARLRLWSAMERRFPKKFVKQIKRLKQHQDVQLSRVRKAGGGPTGTCEDPGTIVDALPNEVLMKVFCFLDPFSVAWCMNVCRTWRDICSTDDIWERIVRVTFPKQSRHNNASCDQRQQFAVLVKDDRRALRWWRSGRRYANGRLTWRDPHPVRACRSKRILAPSVNWGCPDGRQVISYIGGQTTIRQDCEASSDDMSGSDDDHDDV